MIRPGTNKATNNDNKFIAIKKQIRASALNKADNKNVLDLYSGDGLMWSSFNLDLHYKIDADNRFKTDYCGDCVTYLKHNDISCFGVIDADSWGSPAKALNAIFTKEWKGVVVCTFCLPVNINPCKILAIDYWGEHVYNSVKKKSILTKGADTLLLSYLKKRGINKVYGHLSAKKCYIWFEIK
jgi:hypothetical protein